MTIWDWFIEIMEFTGFLEGTMFLAGVAIILAVVSGVIHLFSGRR